MSHFTKVGFASASTVGKFAAGAVIAVSLSAPFINIRSSQSSTHTPSEQEARVAKKTARREPAARTARRPAPAAHGTVTSTAAANPKTENETGSFSGEVPVAAHVESPGNLPGEVEKSYSSNNYNYVDLNPIMRAYVEGLGVPPGVGDWNQFGCELFPGQTGGQADFGWRQDHRVPVVADPKYKNVAAKILSNAGFRPVFYLDAPLGTRKGYGRPWDWVPDPVIDDPILTGWKHANGKVVVGHDLQHWSFKHLASLAGRHDFTEQSLAAKVMLWRMAASMGGMLRTEYFKNTIHSSREVGRALDFAIDCAKFSVMDDQDADAILAWVKNAVIPSVREDGIGFVYQPGQQGYKTEPQLGSVDYWFPWQDGLEAAGIDRFGQFLQTLPEKELSDLGTVMRMKARTIAGKTASVITDDGNCPKAVGMDGKIAWVGDEGYGYAVWCYRALRIAGAHAKANAVFERFKAKPEWWSWFVEPNGTYNPKLGLNLDK